MTMISVLSFQSLTKIDKVRLDVWGKGDMMKFNIIGLILLFFCSLGYVAFRISGFYFQGGSDVDLVMLIADSMLFPYFLSQLSQQKFPYLLLIIFIPVILYTWWQNNGLIEAKSDQNGKYLITETMPALCCGKDIDYQSDYAIYDKIRGPFYRKQVEFEYAPQRFMRKYDSEKPTAKDIEEFIINYPYLY